MDVERLVCPYNPHHTARKTVMHTHIAKCFMTSGAKAEGRKEYVGCIYNMAHMMPKADMDAHLLVCEDKIKAEQNSVGIEDLVTCPYNRAHTVSKAKLQGHLLKCKRNHVGPALMVCFYNITHHVYEIDLQKHLLMCPDKLENDRRRAEELARTRCGRMNRPRPSTPPRIEVEEDWEAECRALNVKAYNPQLTIKNKLVIRSLPNASKSMRKQFRADERERHQKLQEAQDKPPTIPGLEYRDDPSSESDSEDESKVGGEVESEDSSEDEEALSIAGAIANNPASGPRLKEYLEKLKMK